MSETRWGAYVTQRLDALAAGSDDFTGLTRPSAATVAAARALAAAEFPPEIPTPSVVPGDGGSVLFVWLKRGWDIEIEILAEGASAMARNRDNDESWVGSWGKQGSRTVALLKRIAEFDG